VVVVVKAVIRSGKWQVVVINGRVE
jgi:hypothetical protein